MSGWTLAAGVLIAWMHGGGTGSKRGNSPKTSTECANADAGGGDGSGDSHGDLMCAVRTETCIDCDQPPTYYGMYCPEHIPKWDPVANWTKQTEATRDEEQEQP